MTRCELGLDVGRTMIAVEESFAAWRKDPQYVKVYNLLEDEFSQAAATAMRLRISFEPAPVRRGKLGDFRRRSSD